jgi:hypothetical protein
MLRRLLAGAVLAGAAATVAAAAAPANAAEPGPGPLAGAVSPHVCQEGGGSPVMAPFQQLGPIHSTGMCLGGLYSFAPLALPGGIGQGLV